jgi:hypothetical protein
MKYSIQSLRYYSKNWKLFIHLLLRTKRFGVNNKWWNEFDSLFGLSTWKIMIRIITVRPLITELTKIKFRVVACHFMTDEEKEIIGWTKM